MQGFESKGFVVLLWVVTIAFFWLLLPFYGAVFWAVILAIVFNPVHRRLEARFGQRSNTAAFLSVLICIVIAIIPMGLILGSVVNQGSLLVQRAQRGDFDTSQLMNELQTHIPAGIHDQLERLGLADFEAIRDRLVNAMQQLGQIVASQALSLGQNTLRFVAAVGIMLYVLFFLFRDGPRIRSGVRACMPLPDAYTTQLSEKFAAVVKATVKGNLVIATIQGTIGGVTLWMLGVYAPLLWGTVMIFLSLLPAIGAAIVWVPIAIYFMLSGELIKGLILIGIGGGVIGLVDNLLRPTLVGKDTRLPDYVILVSTVGGLSLFGINGFVIGPLIAALFFTVWGIYRDERLGRRSTILLREPHGSP